MLHPAPSDKTINTGYDTIIRATSTNTPNATNDTINRVSTGFISFTKSFTVIYSTGVGAATGYDRNVKALQWRVTAGSLIQTAPNNAGSVSFIVLLR